MFPGVGGRSVYVSQTLHLRSALNAQQLADVYGFLKIGRVYPPPAGIMPIENTTRILCVS
jgi:hypothetical protein